MPLFGGLLERQLLPTRDCCVSDTTVAASDAFARVCIVSSTATIVDSRRFYLVRVCTHYFSDVFIRTSFAFPFCLFVDNRTHRCGCLYMWAGVGGIMLTPVGTGFCSGLLSGSKLFGRSQLLGILCITTRNELIVTTV